MTNYSKQVIYYAAVCDYTRIIGIIPMH